MNSVPKKSFRHRKFKIIKKLKKGIDICLQCGIMIIEKERNSRSEQGKRK